MKILHKYVLKEHLGPLTFALSALTSIMLLNYIAKRFGDLVGKGLPWTAIAEFFLLAIPFTIALTLPMAVLVATLYAFSRLASENEITALRASGVGLPGILAPVLIAGLGVTVVMIIFNDQILPRTNHRLAQLQSDIAQTKPTFALREQVINEMPGGRLYLRTNHLDERSNRMREVTIYDMSDPTVRRTIYADSGNLAMAPNRRDLLMTLYHGYIQDVPTAQPVRLQRVFFGSDVIRVANVMNQFQKSDSAGTAKGDREMSVCEMQHEVDKAEKEYEMARQSYLSTVALAEAEKVNMAPLLAHTNAPKVSPVSLGRAYCRLLAMVGTVGGGDSAAAQRTGTPPVVPRQDTAAARAAARTVTRTTARAVTRPPARTARMSDSGTMATRRRRDSATAALRRDSMLAAFRRLNAARLQSESARAAMGTMRAGPRPPDSARPATMNPGAFRGIPPEIAARLGKEFQRPTITPMMVDATRTRMLDARQQMAEYEVEIHKKFALAVACFIFVMLGAPIALRFPRGGVGLTIGVSLFVFALYYVGLIAGESLANHGIVPAGISMWSANIVFGAVALVLLSQMGKEGSTARGGDAREAWDNVRRWTGRRLRALGAVRERRRPEEAA